MFIPTLIISSSCYGLMAVTLPNCGSVLQFWHR